MPLFFNTKTPKVVDAYSLKHCPPPIEDWVTEKPDYFVPPAIPEKGRTELKLDKKTELEPKTITTKEDN